MPDTSAWGELMRRFRADLPALQSELKSTRSLIAMGVLGLVIGAFVAYRATRGSSES
jgi:hypothetical protein